MKWRLACAVCCVAACAQAAESSVGLALETDQLSNNTPAWRAISLEWSYKSAPRYALQASLNHIERFGLSDHQATAQAYFPLAENWDAEAGVEASASHNVLAQRGFHGALHYQFVPAWIANFGLRQRSYTRASTRALSLGLEHYLGAASVAANIHPVRAFGRTVNGYDLRWSYDYGKTSRIGLVQSGGQELVDLPGGAQALSSVRALALTGRHHLDGHWSFQYALGRTRQGDLYSRSSVRAGLQYTE